jgi:rare lipoprotein A
MTRFFRRTLLMRAAPAMLLLLPAMPADASVFQQCGKASWYKLGGTTASGERSNPDGLTAAHRTLPFGTLVTVTNLANGKSVTVRINDRGPYAKGRVIDVTRAAAAQLGFIRKGVTQVQVTSHAPNPPLQPKQFCQ